MTNEMPLLSDKRQPPLNLGGANSIFLDLLRLSCACIVLMHHAIGILQEHAPSALGRQFAPGSFLWLVAHADSHWAVIVFFVLSGYVIAHVTSRTSSFPDYMTARLSRLYSILVPALVLTALVELLVRFHTPELLAEFVRGASLPRYGITLFLVNELWLFSAAPKINGPLWSLSFELWYYLIFGLWFFRNQIVYKGGLALIACVVAGPKILLLMPCWFVGVLAYKASQRFDQLPFRGLPTAVALIAFSLFLLRYTRGWPGGVGEAPLFFAAQFLTDWISAGVVALALVMLPRESSLHVPVSVFRLARRLGDLTYPIYALHMPILVFLIVVAPVVFDVAAPTLPVLVTTTVLVTLLLGVMGERSREFWQRLFAAIIVPMSRISARIRS